MSHEDRLSRIRALAAHRKHEGEHRDHETHTQDERDGKRAAEADLPRIAEAIEKRMEKKVLGSRTLGRHVAREGYGEHTWVMPHDFRSSASGLPYQRVVFNSHAFLAAYKKALGKALGPDITVHIDGHGSDSKIIFTWAPNPKPHGH